MKIALLKTLDGIVGTVLARSLPGAVAGDLRDLRSILIIRPGGIGDAILLIPAINLLKERYPGAGITVLAERRNAGAFRLCPAVDRVLLYDRPGGLYAAIRGGCDLVIDSEQWHRLSAVVARLTGSVVSVGFSTNERRRLFTHPLPYSHDDYEADSFLNLLAPLGIDPAGGVGTPFLVVPEAAKARAAALLTGLAGRPFVAVFPGASIAERRWGRERFAAVARRLGARGVPVVVVGGEGERDDGEWIVRGTGGLNLAGRTSLLETAAVIGDSSALLSGDSGVLHMGVGLGRPTVSLFGPGIAAKWAPRGGGHVVIRRPLPCSPCTRFGYTPRCRIGARCMAEIGPDQVAEAVAGLMDYGKVE